MHADGTAKLRSLLEAYAERKAKTQHVATASDAEGERRRRGGGDILRTVVRPVLEEVLAQLRIAGHDASTRDHTDRDDAYPSVALSFTPRAANSPDALSSAIIFRYDPRRGIVVQRDVKPSPRRKTVTLTGDRSGTMGVDVVSTAWVVTKTLDFIEAVLKAN
ncbi:MAG TPA: hypothetical protein VFP39_07075 [Gemmatimonadales bacterium]|nr:hypothetical protein [Gemmatimonadales bacterium]